MHPLAITLIGWEPYALKYVILSGCSMLLSCGIIEWKKQRATVPVVFASVSAGLILGYDCYMWSWTDPRIKSVLPFSLLGGVMALLPFVTIVVLLYRKNRRARGVE
jgi:ABC-type proline/glycine betaine transport system permease subunit